MKDIRRMVRTWEGLLGRRTASLLGLKYEQAYYQGSILLPPPVPQLSDGEFSLGKVIWNRDVVGNFGLREEEIMQHISIFGRTGAGKTNLALLLLYELFKKGKSFLILDWKQTYRQLSNTTDTKLFTPGYHEAPFYFNPLSMDDIPEQLRDTYIRHLMSVILDVYFRELRLLTTEGAEHLLLRGIRRLRADGCPASSIFPC